MSLLTAVHFVTLHCAAPPYQGRAMTRWRASPQASPAAVLQLHLRRNSIASLCHTHAWAPFNLLVLPTKAPMHMLQCVREF